MAACPNGRPRAAACDQGPDAPAARGNFRVTAKRNEDIQSRIDQVFAALGNPAKQVVVEAMGPTYYTGAQKAFDRGGHFAERRERADRGRFNADKLLSPAEIRKMFEQSWHRLGHEIHTRNVAAASRPAGRSSRQSF